jgi:N6-L-threonylcarbamoyladenine synthase
VSANSGLREAVQAAGRKYKLKTYIPKLSYTTDNAAMIAMVGYHKFLKGEFASQDAAPYARQA